MEIYSLLKSILALAFVIGLIGCIGFLLKKFGEKSLGFFYTDKMAGYKIEEILKAEERNAVETAKAPADENIKDTDEKNNYRRNARRK